MSITPGCLQSADNSKTCKSSVRLCNKVLQGFQVTLLYDNNHLILSLLTMYLCTLCFCSCALPSSEPQPSYDPIDISSRLQRIPEGQSLQVPTTLLEHKGFALLLRTLSSAQKAERASSGPTLLPISLKVEKYCRSCHSGYTGCMFRCAPAHHADIAVEPV